jgi:hypothetical protein
MCVSPPHTWGERSFYVFTNAANERESQSVRRCTTSRYGAQLTLAERSANMVASAIAL